MRDICDSEVSPVVPGDGLFLSGGGSLCEEEEKVHSEATDHASECR